MFAQNVYHHHHRLSQKRVGYVGCSRFANAIIYELTCKNGELFLFFLK